MTRSTVTPFAEGVWLDTAPVRILGMKLSATMAVIRADDGQLLLDSPLALDEARRAAVSALGEVAHIYVPNLFHHSWCGEWAQAFPDARVHGPEGLTAKRPDLRVDRRHGELEPAFEQRFDEVPIGGFRLAEAALFHRPSATLFVADLVHAVGRPEHVWTRVYTKLMGFYDRVAISRMIRWLSFPDRAAARRSLDRVLALPIERLVVGHGEPLEVDAKRALREAYAWLPLVEPRQA